MPPVHSASTKKNGRIDCIATQDSTKIKYLLGECHLRGLTYYLTGMNLTNQRVMRELEGCATIPAVLVSFDQLVPAHTKGSALAACAGNGFHGNHCHRQTQSYVLSVQPPVTSFGRTSALCLPYILLVDIPGNYVHLGTLHVFLLLMEMALTSTTCIVVIVVML